MDQPAFSRQSPEPGVHLSVTIHGDQVTIQYAAHVRHAPRESLRLPVLTKGRLPTLPGPASEHVLFVLDENGLVLDQFGWSVWMDEFFDLVSPDHDRRLLGSPGRSSDGTRIWRVPLREGARYLYFVRSDVTQGQPQQGLVLRQRPLALYWIGPPQVPPPPVPPLPVPWPHPPHPLPLPMQPNPQLGGPFVGPPPPPMTCGHIVGVVPILESGPIDRRFNIVVVGDGFTESELGLYDQRVSTLFGLRPPPGPPLPPIAPSTPILSILPGFQANIDLGHMEPFQSVWGSINAWSVRTVSEESGHSLVGCDCNDCRCDLVRRTYYRVKGCFEGKPNPGYVGIDDADQAILHAALARAGVPLEHVHLFIVIVNYPQYGGSAFPHQKLAFADVGDGTDLAEWVQLVAHECSHAIAHTAEERIAGVAKDPAEIYPNQATLAEVDGNTVRWQGLADPQREISNGRFKAIHKSTDPLDSSGQPLMADQALSSMLGAFWGCQNFDTGQPDDVFCDSYRDVRGRNFFRPMAVCRMRKLEWAFCRVCQDVITQKINAACV
jgi:hypothetical protein